MPNMTSPSDCPEEEIHALLVSTPEDGGERLHALERLLSDYPNDARLLFLKGSLLAGEGKYAAARLIMRQALDAAPGFVTARFQLGLLELTSGAPIAAQETWGPLHSLPRDHFLRLFVTGLCHLIRDEFDDAIHCLEDGISRNQENLPMNGDMQRIVEEIRKKLPDRAGSGSATSSVDLLLQQASLGRLRH